MKKIFFLAVVLFLFLFIFFKSGTWKTYKKIEMRDGVEYVGYKHRLHWDRFFNYIKNIPKKILESDILKPLPIK